MRVNRRLNLVDARFHVSKEIHQLCRIETFGKAFTVHKTAMFEFGIGVKKAICGQEIDPRMVGPARQQGSEHTSRRALAHGDGACNTNNKGHFDILKPQKLR